MIDPALFAKEFQLLCTHFKKKWDTSLAARYYDEISDRLDDERFVDVVKILFYEFDRFPRPIDFIKHSATIDSVIGPPPVRNPHDTTVVPVSRNGVEHEKMKRWRQEWKENVDYYLDSRGYRCSVRSRHHENEEGHGFPVPFMRLV